MYYNNYGWNLDQTYISHGGAHYSKNWTKKIQDDYNRWYYQTHIDYFRKRDALRKQGNQQLRDSRALEQQAQDLSNSAGQDFKKAKYYNNLASEYNGKKIKNRLNAAGNSVPFFGNDQKAQYQWKQGEKNKEKSKNFKSISKQHMQSYQSKLRDSQSAYVNAKQQKKNSESSHKEANSMNDYIKKDKGTAVNIAKYAAHKISQIPSGIVNAGRNLVSNILSKFGSKKKTKKKSKK